MNPIESEIQAVIGKHDGGALAAYLFGSCGSGRMFADSDLDVAIHELQTMLEAVSDMATHVVAGANLGTPPDRPTAIEMLGANAILSEPLAQRVAKAVRMRNILVHHYPSVNVKKVHQVIQNDLGGIEDFCAEIAKLLEGEGAEPAKDN